MPLLKRNLEGARVGFSTPVSAPPGSASGDRDISSGGGFEDGPPLSRHRPLSLCSSNVPRFLQRRPLALAASAAAAAATAGLGGVCAGDASGASSELMGVKRSVLYPEARGTPQGSIVATRLAKRAHIDYHQPEPASRPEPPKQATDISQDVASVLNEKAATTTATSAGGAADPFLAQPKAEVTADGEEDSDTDEHHIVSCYPVSPYGKLYFQVECDAATRHDSVGIIIIDVELMGVMMFDCVGRQHGSRPDPGYPLKPEEVAQAKAGAMLKVGTKQVLLITALTEEAFRSGAFFLRSEHGMRIKEDKAKAKAEAVAAAAKAVKPNMSFGLSLLGSGGGGSMATLLFAAPSLRRRPSEGQTGFTVPLAGRPKVGKNGLLEDLKPLHDPDRSGAVVLFRADYKLDSHGRRQVSVVVDPVLGDKLRPHQRIGVKFLFDCITGTRMPGYHGAILADEMGLGKTIQTVATIYTCLKQGKHGQPVARKCLVVTPSSLVKNWCNEFDKWLGEGAVKHFAISESTPKGDRIISRFDGDGDVLVISYDQLRKYIDRIATLKSVELVVCDEGHRLKNAEVKTTKAVDMLPTRNRIILSGTPIQNDLSEFHAMVNFVNPGILGNSDLFTRVFEEPISIGRDPESLDDLKSLGRDRAHYLSFLTQRFILRRTQTINESYLPPKVDMTVFVKLGSVQERTYQQLAGIVEGSACTPLVLISAMRKLCNHMDLFEEAVRLSHQQAAPPSDSGNGRARSRRCETGAIPFSVLPKGFARGNLSPECGSKLQFVALMLDEIARNGERDKLVIVSNFTQTLDIIAALCKRKGISYFQLDGSTPIKKRQVLVDYFNVPSSQEIVFLLSSKAGGVGLNLIGANRLILFDPDWNPANDAQAMGRVWRDGQKKRVFIYRLLTTGTIEEKIYQRQVSKQGLSANVVDMQEDSKQHFTLEELKALFKYKSDTLCETHDLLGCSSCEASLFEQQQRKLKGGQTNTPTKMKFKKVSTKKSSGPRMDELKAWQHVCDIAHFTLDSVTRAMAAVAPQLISFLFANERDSTKTTQHDSMHQRENNKSNVSAAVTVERPFQSDEDTIICASQAALQEDETQLEIEVHDESEVSTLSSNEEEDN